VKRLIFLFFLISTVLNITGQSVNQNYIFTSAPQIADTSVSALSSFSASQNFQTVQYFDFNTPQNSDHWLS
jgi:hypothetical protein